MAGKTIVILGGGFGGIVCANTLKKLLPEEHKVILLTKQNRFHIGATKTWVMLGERSAQEVTRTLDGLKARGIDVRIANVQAIDAERKRVQTDAGEITGDYLVVALGADYDLRQVEGLDTAYEFYTMEGAERTREVLKGFQGGDVLLLVPRTPFKCPPAPYEAAFLLHDFFKRHNLLSKTRMTICTVESRPMATAGPEIGDFVMEELAKRQIAYLRQKKALAVEASRKVVRFEDGEERNYDLLITIPPHIAPACVRSSGLTAPSGWIPVDSKTLRHEGAGIYAIGDVSVVSLPGRFQPDQPLVLPKAGVFAEAQARVVAENITAEILGKEPRALFDGKGFCYIELGDRHAVRGDGYFFELPHPRMEKRVPDMIQYEEKQAWVRNWYAENL
jgi:sulfide:quinone oxidoreductase